MKCPSKETSEQKDEAPSEGWVWTAGNRGACARLCSPPWRGLPCVDSGGALVSTWGGQGPWLSHTVSSLERKHGWAWVQGAGIPGLAAATVPLAFFVENYRAIVNLSHIPSRACLG